MEDEKETEELENEESSVENQEQKSVPAQIVDTAGNAATKIAQTKMIASILAVIGPFVFLAAKIIFVILVVAAVFVLVIEMFLSAVNFIQNTGDKVWNLFQYGKLQSSEQIFVNTLTEEYAVYNSYASSTDEFDLPIIMATVNYGRMMNLTGFDDSFEYIEKIFDDTESGLGKFIPSSDVNDFYAAMNNELGKIYTLDPSERKLLAHLAGFRIDLECRPHPVYEYDEDLTTEENEKKEREQLENFFDSVLSGYKSFFDFFVESADAKIKNPSSGIFPTHTLMKTKLKEGVTLLSNLYSYKQSGYTGDIYVFLDSNKLRANVEHDFQTSSAVVKRILENSTIQQCGALEAPVPKMELYMDYELYEMYLEEYYLPKFQLDCPSCEYKDIPEDDPYRDLVINRMIKEIYYQRNFFIDYIPQLDGSDFAGGYQPGQVYDFSNLLQSGKFIFNYNSTEIPAHCQSLNTLMNFPTCVTSEFGNPRPGERKHAGIDFGITRGTEIYAYEDGVVTIARCQNSCGTNLTYCPNCSSGYGLYIQIDHAGGLQTRYAHLHQLESGIAVGTKVKAGQLIAVSGDSGVGRAHLHFEIRYGGTPDNPRETLEELISSIKSNQTNNDSLLEQ